MDKLQTLHSFWSGFELKAYEENSVPDAAVMPYVTYEAQSDSFDGGGIPLSASLWYNSSSWTNITKKSDEISRYIGMGGRLVKCDDGYLWIKRRSPFSQSLTDDTDSKVKRKILLITVEFWTND